MRRLAIRMWRRAARWMNSADAADHTHESFRRASRCRCRPSPDRPPRDATRSGFWCGGFSSSSEDCGRATRIGFFKAWRAQEKSCRAERTFTKRAPSFPTGVATIFPSPSPGYPLSGCFPAEPDSVSPGTVSVTHRRRSRFHQAQETRSRIGPGIPSRP